jgi:hypothetical protein
MFHSIFGEDFALARETDRLHSSSPPNDMPLARETKGRIIYANLPNSVAAFFANGGRRCYVVRVAGKNATSTRFQVPGIVALGSDGTIRHKPVFAFASSPGRWSASLRLSTRLNLVPLPKDKFTLQDTHHLDWDTGSAPLAIQSGDLLRLTLDNGDRWLFPVSSIKNGEKNLLQLEANTVWQVLDAATTSPPLTTESFSLVDESVSSPPLRLSHVERLRFDLSVNDADQHRITVRELSFNAPHPRFWGEAMLLESSPLHRCSSFDGTLQASQNKTEASLAARATQLYRMLQKDDRVEMSSYSIDPILLSGLLAPLEEDNQSIYLPLAMLQTNSDPVDPNQNDIGNDDLDVFEPSLFLDEHLIPLPHNISSAAANTLMAAASDHYYLQNRRLHGLHSLTFIDEVALVSIPDANHCGWERKPAETVESPRTDTNTNPIPLPTKTFLNCGSVLTVQAVEPAIGSVTGGTQVIITVTGTGFVLVTDTRISFGDSLGLEVKVLSPTELQCKTPIAGSAGAVSVTVTTENASGTLANAFTYQWLPTIPLLPETVAVNEFDLNTTLLPLHQALINFCQARTDIVGILTLPAHFEKHQCIEWQERLRVQLGLPRRRTPFNDMRDLADLSYVAVYHPWLRIRDTTARDGLRSVSPDGVVCGMIAAREHTRQVWVAPANVPVHGALGLTPNFTEDDWADLYAAQFNLIREEVRDMRVMSAHTLSDERSLLQLSVRRLLIQLRKAAVEKGMDYAFASNHENTRNAIRISLENLLRFMFERGAFAGATQPSAFRIITDISVNPQQSVDQGRLIAQIQIAPSEPLEFITVQLIRTGEDLLQATEI